MKTIKILLSVLIILALGVLVPVGIALNKASKIKNEIVKYKDEADKAKDALGEAVVKTQRALTTLALVASDLAECQGVDKDSVNDISYIKGLLIKKYNASKITDNE